MFSVWKFHSITSVLQFDSILFFSSEHAMETFRCAFSWINLNNPNDSWVPRAITLPIKSLTVAQSLVYMTLWPFLTIWSMVNKLRETSGTTNTSVISNTWSFAWLISTFPLPIISNSALFATKTELSDDLIYETELEFWQMWDVAPESKNQSSSLPVFQCRDRYCL